MHTKMLPRLVNCRRGGRGEDMMEAGAGKGNQMVVEPTKDAAPFGERQGG
jgi:hypothetical protein